MLYVVQLVEHCEFVNSDISSVDLRHLQTSHTVMVCSRQYCQKSFIKNKNCDTAKCTVEHILDTKAAGYLAYIAFSIATVQASGRHCYREAKHPCVGYCFSTWTYYRRLTSCVYCAFINVAAAAAATTTAVKVVTTVVRILRSVWLIRRLASSSVLHVVDS